MKRTLPTLLTGTLAIAAVASAAQGGAVPAVGAAAGSPVASVCGLGTSDARRTLDLVRDRYAAATTYYDTGTATITVESANGTILTSARFTTAFDRRRGFRWAGDVDWSASSQPGVSSSRHCELRVDGTGAGDEAASDAALSTWGVAVMGLGMLGGGGLGLSGSATVDTRIINGEGWSLLRDDAPGRRTAVLVTARGAVVAYESVRELAGATVTTSVRFGPVFDESIPSFLLGAGPAALA